jgi:putative hydrolase of the HAD superfamily
MIKAIGFDIGHTLIKYDNPLNLSSLYRPALEHVISKCNIKYSDEKIETAVSILTKYNTRVNPREIEISSDVIFGEIFDSWFVDLTFLNKAKSSFFSFLQSSAAPFIEVEPVLSKLKSINIQIGVFTNVAYGMDNHFSLKDIDAISQYIDIALTSVDVGFRKPNSAGFKMLLTTFDIQPFEMLFVGDEEVDIIGANNLGIGSVLINRSSKELDYGQIYTINSLNGIMDILQN